MDYRIKDMLLKAVEHDEGALKDAIFEGLLPLSALSPKDNDHREIAVYLAINKGSFIPVSFINRATPRQTATLAINPKVDPKVKKQAWKRIHKLLKSSDAYRMYHSLMTYHRDSLPVDIVDDIYKKRKFIAHNVTEGQTNLARFFDGSDYDISDAAAPIVKKKRKRRRKKGEPKPKDKLLVAIESGESTRLNRFKFDALSKERFEEAKKAWFKSEDNMKAYMIKLSQDWFSVPEQVEIYVAFRDSYHYFSIDWKLTDVHFWALDTVDQSKRFMQAVNPDTEEWNRDGDDMPLPKMTLETLFNQVLFPASFENERVKKFVRWMDALQKARLIKKLGKSMKSTLSDAEASALDIVLGAISLYPTDVFDFDDYDDGCDDEDDPEAVFKVIDAAFDDPDKYFKYLAKSDRWKTVVDRYFGYEYHKPKLIPVSTKLKVKKAS